MDVTHVFAGIPTADYAVALPWYERFLGRAPDRFPRAGEAVWQLAERGLVYLVEDHARAGSALLTLIVEDLELAVVALREQGIAHDPIETIPNAVRRTIVSDLDRNRIQLGQVLPARG